MTGWNFLSSMCKPMAYLLYVFSYELALHVQMWIFFHNKNKKKAFHLKVKALINTHYYPCHRRHACMGPHVNLQVTRFDVFLITTLTRIWFLASMYPHVDSQLCRYCETFHADCALERLFACMTSDMLTKMRWMMKPVKTHGLLDCAACTHHIYLYSNSKKN